MPVNYWLIKSEPFVYGFDDLEREKIGRWDGVRNYAARNNLRAMAVGDLLLFYHSNEGLAVVGLARVARTAYPDPTAEKGDWSCIDVAPVKKMARSVTLAEIKAAPALAQMGIIKLSRLSVSAVTEAEFLTILKMGETEL